MANALIVKRLKFLFTSVLLSLLLSLSSFLVGDYRIIFPVVISLFSLLLFIWSLDAFNMKSLWVFLFILPLHISFGVFLTYIGFPNLSIFFRLIVGFLVLILYYITLLVLNIFVVVEEKGKIFPLYRAATTWAQILVVLISIPFYAGVFKLNIGPLGQIGLVTFSAFCLVLFYLWLIDLEVNEWDLSLAFLSAFWILMMLVAVVFVPFEALFRSLFISSVLLFCIGYVHGLLKHSLSSKIIIEHVLIIVLFLILGLLFLS